MALINKFSLPLAFAFCTTPLLANENTAESLQSYFIGLTDTCSGLIATFDSHSQALLITRTETVTKGVFPFYMRDGKRKVTICATADEIDSGIKQRQGSLDKSRQSDIEGRRAVYRAAARFIFESLPKERRTPQKMIEILEKEDRLAEKHERTLNEDFEAEIKAWKDGAQALREQNTTPRLPAP